MSAEPSAFATDRAARLLTAVARLHELNYMLCPHCDYEVKEDFLRCPNRARKLRDPCASCARPLDPTWKLCPYCEAETGETPAPSTAASRRRRRSSTTDQPTVAHEPPR